MICLNKNCKWEKRSKMIDTWHKAIHQEFLHGDEYHNVVNVYKGDLINADDLISKKPH